MTRGSDRTMRERVLVGDQRQLIKICLKWSAFYVDLAVCFSSHQQNRSCYPYVCSLVSTVWQLLVTYSRNTELTKWCHRINWFRGIITPVVTIDCKRWLFLRLNRFVILLQDTFEIRIPCVPSLCYQNYRFIWFGGWTCTFPPSS